ncbi:hypothetical protein VR45_26290 [Streptomyces sp. NRRL S-495]|nr:hypothetical protein VR45_26290 [Streptomyces sp. NRRL S-495]
MGVPAGSGAGGGTTAVLGSGGFGVAPPDGFAEALPPPDGAEGVADADGSPEGRAEGVPEAGADGVAPEPPDAPEDGEAVGAEDGPSPSEPGRAPGLGRPEAPPSRPAEGEGTAAGPEGGASPDGLRSTRPPSEVPVPDSPWTVADTGRPVASSKARIGTIATVNTRAETAAYVRQLHRRRARTTRGVLHSAEPGGGAGSARSGSGACRSPFASCPGPAVRSTTPRSCSPVRRKRCWNSAPPVVAPMLTTAAPRMVPYTPSSDASTAPTTVASALAAT